jgi:hypothetical protein
MYAHYPMDHNVPGVAGIDFYEKSRWKVVVHPAINPSAHAYLSSVCTELQSCKAQIRNFLKLYIFVRKTSLQNAILYINLLWDFFDSTTTPQQLFAPPSNRQSGNHVNRYLNVSRMST